MKQRRVLPGDRTRAAGGIGVHFTIPAPRACERDAKEGSPLWLGACRESDLCDAGDAPALDAHFASGNGVANGVHSAASNSNGHERAAPASRMSTVIELDARTRQWGAKERRGGGCGQRALHRCAAVLIVFALLLVVICFSMLALHFVLRAELDVSRTPTPTPSAAASSPRRAEAATPWPLDARPRVVISLFSPPDEPSASAASDRPTHSQRQQPAPNAQPLGDSPVLSGKLDCVPRHTSTSCAP